MRDRLWRLATARHPVCMKLTRRLLVIRAILYPLDFLYWQMSKTRGYDYESDTWNIGGVRYTGAALRALANARGETYRIIRVGRCVVIERLDDEVSEDGSRRHLSAT